MRALWIILKTTCLSLMAWTLAVFAVGGLMASGTYLLTGGLPLPLLTILAGCWCLFLMVALVRMAWTGPMLTAELDTNYYSNKRSLVWSLIVWPSK